MARSNPNRPVRNSSPNTPSRSGIALEGQRRTTGYFFVLFRENVVKDPKSALNTLNKAAGLKDVVASADFSLEGISTADSRAAECIYLNKLGVAVVSEAEAGRQSRLSALATSDSNILAVEPEYIMEAINSGLPSLNLDYIRGYRDSINHLYEQLTGGSAVAAGGAAAVSFQDTDQFTWGLQATGVNTSRFRGAGINVAILDTGLDLLHVDFLGRAPVTKSFIPNETVQDIAQHGTHCAGTACGPQSPAANVRRYGCAFGANLFIGKVLGDDGFSVPGSVVQGMDWALTNGCHVISMSLGARVDQVSQTYEEIGQRALDQGCLIVAAAGNNARRESGNVGFVEQPANSKTIMAVAALDDNLQIARFSARSSSLTGVGGKIDIAAPGVNVFSSIPGGHDSFNGTSMATPHVAGIAAMIAESTGARGSDLWNRLTQSAKSLPLPQADVGSGLVQAPQ